MTLDELKRWEQFMNDATGVTKQTALYFLFGCYTGLRISDIQVFDFDKNIEGNRLRLRAKKNGEYVAMMVSKPLQRILKIVQAIPLTIEEQTANKELKKIAKHKDVKINKHLTLHSARHTFAITLCADQGISSETCAELMGITVATCVSSYYRVTNRKIDKETAAAWDGLK